LREDTLSVEAAYNDGPRRLYGQLELFISNPENARKARILDVEGKTILPEELPIGGIVHITFDGHIYSPEPHQRQIRNAYSIQIVDALPEAA
jgi:hypothetical protein